MSECPECGDLCVCGEDSFDCEREDADCSHCGGDGYVECHDPIECTSPHTSDGLCPCASCGGSGNASDQTIW